MRLHLCGPMRGRPHFNHAAFAEAAGALRAAGHVVSSPTDHDREVGFDPFKGEDPTPEQFQKMFAWNLAQLTAGSSCFPGSSVFLLPAREPLDGAVFLDGWSESVGARLEFLVALRCGLKLFEFNLDRPGRLERVKESDWSHMDVTFQ